MWPNPQETADLVTFTEEILNGKIHFLCSAWFSLEPLHFNPLVIESVKYTTFVIFVELGSIFILLSMFSFFVKLKFS